MRRGKGRCCPRLADDLLPLLFALAAAAPLWGAGMVETRGGGDSPFLLWRVAEMTDALRAGLFPVRWMPDAACGLGYPFFNYYAALPYYLAAALHGLGLPILVAIQAVQTLGLILAALTFGRWVAGHLRSPWARTLAVAAYTFAPFHLVNLYVRGDSLSEFFAFVWYPLILLAIDRLAERPASKGRLVAAALAYAALILTHNVSALIFAPFALGYALLRSCLPACGQRAAWGRAARVVVAPFLLALLLSLWFWLPALAELDYGQLGEAFTAGYFHYDRHFRAWNLVQRTWRFDYRVAGSADEAGPFAMGAVQALMALVGAVVLLVRRSGTRGWRLFLLGGGALATLMITPLSAPLWARIGLLAKTQFPWRFLSVQALFTAALTGVLLEEYGAREARWRLPAALLLVGATLWAALADLHPERLLIADEDVTREHLLFYESFTANLGTTIRYEYLPREVVPRLYISEVVVDGVGALRADGQPPPQGTLLSATPRGQRWQVRLERDALVAFPVNAWPGWSAEVDGVPVEVSSVQGSGRLAVAMEAGRHEVVLRLRETPLRRLADLLSLGALLVLAGWGGVSLRRRRPSFGAARLVVAALVVAVGLPWGVHRCAPLPAPATLFDFVRSPWPHRGVADFGGLRAAIAPMEIEARPAETITVPLRSLAVSEPLTVTLRLVSPAEPRHGVPCALSEHTFPADAPPSAWSLRLPDDLPRGLYLVNLRVAGRRGALTARSMRGAPLGDLYVGIVRVRHGPQAEGRPQARFPDLHLEALWVRQTSPQTVAVGMRWSAPLGTPRNWSLSLRLHDVEGRTLAQWDGQPGYGYLPTTLWSPGEAVSMTVGLALPYGTAPGSYRLEVVTYLEATMGDGASATFPVTLTQATLWNSREEHCPLVRKGLTLRCPAGDLFLKKVEMPERIVEGQPLDFTAEWTAIATPRAALRARWEVVDGDGEVVASVEGPPAAGSDTRLWPRFALVRAPVRLVLPPLLDRPPYHLVLTVEGGEASYRCEMEEPLPVERRPRCFAPPAEIEHPLSATFGGLIRLLGYDLDRGEEGLRLTLWWQAVAQPGRDYKRFVHLYGEDGRLLAQDDAVPREWHYPTSWWAAGEVVSETVTLEAVPGGRRLGFGWYDPQTLERLPARDGAGQALPDDLLIVPLEP